MTRADAIGLKPGNIWEPAIVRNMVNECQALGNDANARAFIEAKWCNQLGLHVEE